MQGAKATVESAQGIDAATVAARVRCSPHALHQVPLCGSPQLSAQAQEASAAATDKVPDLPQKAMAAAQSVSQPGAALPGHAIWLCILSHKAVPSLLLSS